jgi:uncharacterized membrane protein
MTDLFSYVPARKSDPDTSREAAISLDLPHLERIVLKALMSGGPMTSNELADFLRMPLVTVSPRLRPLADKGLIEDTELRRAGSSGRKSIVWARKPVQPQACNKDA